MTTRSQITPSLWFDRQSEEAAQLYASLFPNSRITEVIRAAADTPSGPAGSVLTVEFELAGQSFIAINGGPHFVLNPSISLFVNCDSAAEVDALYSALADGGMTLMPLQAYPFSQRFAWVQDRFGLSWQLNLGGRAQKITPALLFVGDQAGKAESAMRLYTSLFPNSGIDYIERFSEGNPGGAPGQVMQALFHLNGYEIRAQDSTYEHPFAFNEALSLMVTCETQAEIDHYWGVLSAQPEAEQCGWLKDPFGVSWQITPTALMEMLSTGDGEAARRVTEAFMPMKKLEIEPLRRAFAG